MTLGGCGYFIYAASFLCYNHTQNEGFVIFAGGLLGACASALWCAQGVVMMVRCHVFAEIVPSLTRVLFFRNSHTPQKPSEGGLFRLRGLCSTWAR